MRKNGCLTFSGFANEEGELRTRQYLSRRWLKMECDGIYSIHFELFLWRATNGFNI